MKKNLLKSLFLVLLASQTCFVQAQTQNNDSLTVVPIDSNITDLIQNTLIGSYVTAFNVSTNVGLPTNAIGLFYNTSSVLDIDYGFVMSTGDVTEITEPASFNASGSLNSGTDVDLDQITYATVNDAVVIEFDYIPFTNVLSFSYVFASEEFPEYVFAGYNDVFGFFVSGPGIQGTFSNNAENIALMPNGQDAVSIDNIFGTPYYIDGANNTQMVFDGYTNALDAIVEVVPFSTYHIKLAVSDAGDSAFDTGVFLKNNSFSSWPLQYSVNATVVPNRSSTSNEISVEGDQIEIGIELPTTAKTDIEYTYTLHGTAEAGVDYEALSGTVSFNSGELTSSILINTIEDNEIEGIEDIILVMDVLNDSIHVSLDDNTTNLNKIEKVETTYSLFPNPAKDKINVENTSFGGAYEIEIYSTSGALVHTETCTKAQKEIDITALESGTYYMVIDNQRQKFVKM